MKKEPQWNNDVLRTSRLSLFSLPGSFLTKVGLKLAYVAQKNNPGLPDWQRQGGLGECLPSLFEVWIKPTTSFLQKILRKELSTHSSRREKVLKMCFHQD